MPFDGNQIDRAQALAGFTPMNHSRQQLYGAALHPVFDAHGEPVPGYQRIVREDTAETLEIVGKTYSFIDNRLIFGEFERAIEESGLDASGMMVATDFGGPKLTRCFRQYVLPAHTIEIKPGVETALRLLMWNSYDGSLKFSGRAGFMTWVCANTSTIGKEIGNFALKHSGEMDFAKAISGLVMAADSHAAQTERLREWPKIGVSDAQAREIICAMDKVSDAQIDHLVHQWVRAKDDLDGPQGGPNLWALFSTLTAWASHGDGAVGGMPGRGAKRGGVGVAVRNMREDQIARVIECEEWKELEAA